MTVPGRRRHGDERGRACLVVAIVLALLVLGGGLLGTRALASPDLGPIRGPAHGDTETAVAAQLGANLLLGLAASRHATVTLSEQDLTTVLRANAGSAATDFRDLQARVRDGLLVVNGQTSAGPFTVTGLGRLALALTLREGQAPLLSARIQSVEVGDLTLPGLVRDAVQRRIEQSVNLQDLLSSDVTLQRLSRFLDCLRVAGDGLVLGFHAPYASAQPDAC